jgi:hypothetical protein
MVIAKAPHFTDTQDDGKTPQAMACLFLCLTGKE